MRSNKSLSKGVRVLSSDIRDVATTIIISLLSVATGGVFFFVYLMYKCLRGEC